MVFKPGIVSSMFTSLQSFSPRLCRHIIAHVVVLPLPVDQCNSVTKCASRHPCVSTFVCTR